MSDSVEYLEVVRLMKAMDEVFCGHLEPALCSAACVNMAGNIATRVDKMSGGVQFRSATITYLREVANGLEAEINASLQ